MFKWFFDISTGFRFSDFQISVWECSVHVCSCPWLLWLDRPKFLHINGFIGNCPGFHTISLFVVQWTEIPLEELFHKVCFKLSGLYLKPNCGKISIPPSKNKCNYQLLIMYFFSFTWIFENKLGFNKRPSTLKTELTPYWDFWKIKFEKSSWTNMDFCLFRT